MDKPYPLSHTVDDRATQRAIKQLERLVDELKKKNEALEKRVAALES